MEIRARLVGREPEEDGSGDAGAWILMDFKHSGTLQVRPRLERVIGSLTSTLFPTPALEEVRK